MTIQRVESGENFKVLGKRLNSSGKVEYLLAWEGLKARGSNVDNVIPTKTPVESGHADKENIQNGTENQSES